MVSLAGLNTVGTDSLPPQPRARPAPWKSFEALAQPPPAQGRGLATCTLHACGYQVSCSLCRQAGRPPSTFVAKVGRIGHAALRHIPVRRLLPRCCKRSCREAQGTLSQSRGGFGAAAPRLLGPLCCTSQALGEWSAQLTRVALRRCWGSAQLPQAGALVLGPPLTAPSVHIAEGEELEEDDGVGQQREQGPHWGEKSRGGVGASSRRALAPHARPSQGPGCNLHLHPRQPGSALPGAGSQHQPPENPPGGCPMPYLEWPRTR